MTILISLLLLAMPGVTFTVAQEGAVLKETCQVFTFEFIHQFINKEIDLNQIVPPNATTLNQVKETITSNAACSVSQVKVINITNSKTIPFPRAPRIVQAITLQIFANESITTPKQRVSALSTCLDSVKRGKNHDELYAANGLNVSGTIMFAIGPNVKFEQKSCCEELYSVPGAQCCRPGFIEDGDKCACSAGQFLNIQKVQCEVCSKDTYQPNSKSVSCVRCPNGTITYNRTGATDVSACQEDCSQGSAFDQQTHTCQDCPLNTYQPRSGTLECIPCPEGTITVNISSTSPEHCIQNCSAGSAFNYKTRICKSCPLNSFQSKAGQTSCLSCPFGKATVNVSTVDEKDCLEECNPGFENRGPSQQCLSCRVDHYKPTKGVTKCIPCPDGRVTYKELNTNVSDCFEECDRGFKFNLTLSMCVKCPRNTTQMNKGELTCDKCPSERRITEYEGTVDQKDCIGICPAGEFYNKTFMMCTSCERASYQPKSGTSKCIKCPKGQTTLDEGAADVKKCIKACPPGSYHVNKTEKCELCSMDSYQSLAGQDSCIACSPFQMTFQLGSTDKGDCFEICLAGEYHNNMTGVCSSCPKNSYQPEERQFSCLPCPNGTLTDGERSQSLQDCFRHCDQGYYRNNTSNNCIKCPRGSYRSEKNTEKACDLCGDGKTTVAEGSTNKSQCITDCSKGLYAPTPNLQNLCLPCPHGHYQPSSGQTACIRCPVDQTTLKEKSTSMEDCYRNCSVGSFYDGKENKCVPCRRGFYQTDSGKRVCTKCQQTSRTTYRKGATSPFDCYPICTEGQYFNSTVQRCLACPVSYYQNLTAATRCIPCPKGTTTIQTGAKAIEGCIIKAFRETSNPEASTNKDLLIAIPVVVVILLISACLLVLFLYRRWKTNENERRMSGRSLDPRGQRSIEDEPEERPKLDSTASMPNHHYRMPGSGLKPDVVRPNTRTVNLPEDLEIPRENLKFLGQVLGKGNFGKVEKAILSKDRTESVVAVKMIKGGGTFSDEKELFDELEMLASLHPYPHPNIVNLIGGSTTSDGPLFVVVEYCAQGNLLKYLQKNQTYGRQKHEYVNIAPKTQKTGIQYDWKLQKALEVCRGMAHLAKFKIIHRDVAARNVLLDENWVAKISDFGMARDVYVQQIYRKDTEGFLPVRWMAIESLESFIYTTQSDVWSFGILLWEIITDGRVPYNNILDHTQLLNFIKSGRIMKRPKNCPKDFYHIMEKCWSRAPSDRPTFQSLKDAIDTLYEDELHKDDALPQRIFRRFSSRRKRRKIDEDDPNTGRKLRAQKSLSNNSGTKIDKIEEEQLHPNNDKEPEDSGIKMQILQTQKGEPTNTDYENKGYSRTGSVTSEEQDAHEDPKTTKLNNSELDTISEGPPSLSSENTLAEKEEISSASSEKTFLDNEEVPETSPPTYEESMNDGKAPLASPESDSGSVTSSEMNNQRKGNRLSSTDR